jgi:glycine oxidase
VVGGGITGAFAAYFLAELGAETTLIERGEIGAEASGNNPGGLNPLHGAWIPGPLQALALESFHLHRAAWDEVRRRSGIEFSPRPAQRLYVATGQPDLEPLERMATAHEAVPGFSARRLDHAQLSAAEPRLTPAAIAGLLTEGNAKVDPRPYTRAVIAAAVARGATVVRAEVGGLHRRGDRVTAVVVDSSPVACDGVVIATGAWCAEPARWLDLPIPVEPVKGELVLVQTPGGGFPVDLAWRDVTVYGVAGGQGWLGGTEDRVGFDRDPSASGREAIVARAVELLPEMGRARVVGHIAGLRPVTRDGFPIVGLAPGWENACLALGGGRKGMLFSTGLGRAAAELMTGGETGLSIAPCSAARIVPEPTAGVAG